MNYEFKLQENKKYRGVCHTIFRINGPDKTHRAVQGAYFDGTHFYIAMMIHQDDGYEVTRIMVLNKDGEFVRASEPLHIDHANNVTYHPGKRQLITSNCQSPDGHYNRYTAIDIDTLTVLESGDKAAPFFSMAYSPEKDMYASGEWAGQTVDFWDGNMELVKSCPVEKPKSLSQGVFADRNYCYFVRSSTKESGAEILAYNWDGELKFQIPISFADLSEPMVEPENINIVDGVCYIIGNVFPKEISDGFVSCLELIEEN